MKKTILLLVILAPLTNLFGQVSLSWVKGLTNNGIQSAKIKGIESSAAGNVYIIGEIQTTTDFDPGPQTYFLSPAISKSCFLAKYDQGGNILWAKEILSQTTNNAVLAVNDLIIDSNENIYITGSYGNTVDFDPSASTFTLNSGTFNGYDNVIPYTAKYNSQGNFLWVKHLKRPGVLGEGARIALDNNSNVYVGANIDNQRSYFYKYNSSGTILWLDSLKGSSQNYLTAMHVTGNGEVFIGGSFYIDIDMDPGINTNSLTASDALYLGKYTTNGAFVWAKKINMPFGNSVEIFNDITVDASGNVYTIGSGLNAGVLQNRITKWNNLGSLQWMNFFGDASLYNGLDISINCNNSLLVTGLVGSIYDNYDTQGGTYTFSPTNDINFFVNGLIYAASYNTSNGGLNWANSFGGSLDWNCNLSSNANFSNSYTDNNGNIFLVGAFMFNSIPPNDFNPDPVITTSLNPTYNTAFFVKYSGCNAVGLDEYNQMDKICIFPNPSSGNFHLKVTSENCTIEVADLTGRLILSKETQEKEMSFSLQDQPPGVYLYTIKNQDGVLQRGKLILEK